MHYKYYQEYDKYIKTKYTPFKVLVQTTKI